MARSKLPVSVGILMMGLAVVCLIGWNFYGWTFVDPFFSTLVFIGAPFFVAMGFAHPRPIPESVRARIPAR